MLSAPAERSSAGDATEPILAIELDDLAALSPRVCFIADLHLSPSPTPRHTALVALLETLSRIDPRPHLCILGDLFHYWTGRHSEPVEGHGMILDALEKAAQAGVDVTLLHGNRDFLIDGRVAARCGVRVVADKLCLALGDTRVLACHGDTLLIEDRSYRRLRWVLRSFWMRELAYHLPRFLVRWIAANIRRSSLAGMARKPERVFAIAPAEAARLLRGGFDVLICGHVHHADRLAVDVDGRRREVITLGAWEERASALLFDGETLRFVDLPIAGATT